MNKVMGKMVFIASIVFFCVLVGCCVADCYASYDSMMINSSIIDWGTDPMNAGITTIIK